MPLAEGTWLKPMLASRLLSPYSQILVSYTFQNPHPSLLALPSPSYTLNSLQLLGSYSNCSFCCFPCALASLCVLLSPLSSHALPAR